MKGPCLLRLIAALGLGLGLGLTLVWLLDGGVTPVTAAPATGVVETPAERPLSNSTGITLSWPNNTSVLDSAVISP